MNKTLLVGNICRDLEKRTTQSGVSVLSFGIAVQRSYKNPQGVYEADFINCIAWREAADFIAQHFIKGNKIGIEGHLQSRTYDAKDGSKRKVTEVVVDHAEFVAPKAQTAPQTNPGTAGAFTEVEDSDLPF